MEDDEEEITAATLRGRPQPLPISALSAFSYVPPRRLDPKEHSYYYRQGQVRRGVARLGAGPGRAGLRVWGAGEGGAARRGAAGLRGCEAGDGAGEGGAARSGTGPGRGR